MIYVASRLFAAVLCGGLLAEAMMQLVLSRAASMPLWYTGRIHEPDSTFGFRFASGYRGAMRHKDGVFFEPLSLDHQGFRLPATHEGAEQRVVLIGGASMVFSYGVAEEDALHTAIRDALSTPSTVVNRAWPGFGLVRSYEAYRRSDTAAAQPSRTVFFVYGETVEKLQRDISQLTSSGGAPERSREVLFRYSEDMVLPQPLGVMGAALGDWYYRSFLVNRLVDAVWRIERFVLPVSRRSSPLRREADTQPIMDSDAIVRNWMQSVVDAQGGARSVLFVFLPSMDQALEHDYERLRSLLPSECRVLDVRDLFQPRLGRDSYLAWGHYRSKVLKRIGHAIAAVLAEDE
jgi:hypothetical protein